MIQKRRFLQAQYNKCDKKDWMFLRETDLLSTRHDNSVPQTRSHESAHGFESIFSKSERQQQRRLSVGLSLHLPHVGVLRAPWNVAIISHNLAHIHGGFGRGCRMNEGGGIARRGPSA